MDCLLVSTVFILFPMSVSEDKMRDILVCPITHQFFFDPVAADDGRIYERSAIKDWLHKSEKSPITGKWMSANLFPATFCKPLLDELFSRHPELKQEQFNPLDTKKPLSELFAFTDMTKIYNHLVKFYPVIERDSVSDSYPDRIYHNDQIMIYMCDHVDNLLGDRYYIYRSLYYIILRKCSSVVIDHMLKTHPTCFNSGEYESNPLTIVMSNLLIDKECLKKIYELTKPSNDMIASLIYKYSVRWDDLYDILSDADKIAYFKRERSVAIFKKDPALLLPYLYKCTYASYVIEAVDTYVKSTVLPNLTVDNVAYVPKRCALSLDVDRLDVIRKQFPSFNQFYFAKIVQLQRSDLLLNFLEHYGDEKSLPSETIMKYVPVIDDHKISIKYLNCAIELKYVPSKDLLTSCITFNRNQLLEIVLPFIEFNVDFLNPVIKYHITSATYKQVVDRWVQLKPSNYQMSEHLNYLVTNEYIDHIGYLHSIGIDLNKQLDGYSGKTLLHVAANAKKHRVVDKLLELGCDPNVIDNKKRTYKDYCCRNPVDFQCDKLFGVDD
jgi:hypothetical protein